MKKPRKRKPPLVAAERRIIAYHEVGHAIVQTVVEPLLPIRSIRIRIDSADQLGSTKVHTGNRRLLTRADMLNKICIFYGGRVAEELLLWDFSDAAQADLVKISEMVRYMVLYLGVSYQFPPQYIDPRTPISEMMRQIIDESINEILEEQCNRARDIILANAQLVQQMADALEQCRCLQGNKLKKFIVQVANVHDDAAVLEYNRKTDPDPHE